MFQQKNHINIVSKIFHRFEINLTTKDAGSVNKKYTGK